ncbi:MAG: peptidoglycan DD-metalloendopeptidase family protein [Propionibacteriaceae bacterium]
MRLISLIPSVILLLVAVVLTVNLWRRRPATKTEWLLGALCAGSVTTYAVLVQPWDFVSYYLRPLLVVAGMGALVVSLVRAWHTPWWRSPGSWRVWLNLVTTGMVGLLFSGLSVVALTGTTPGDDRAVELAFPLQNGVAYVGQGGARTILNYHHVSRSQAYALDIVGLNAAGLHARGVMPTEPERYAVYGRTVHSPCTGTVIEARSDLVDQHPPTTDRVNLAGNHLVLRCSGTTPAVDVLLAHLQQGSVRLTPGARVRVGEVVGRVGNTGNTSEPHLHIHAIRTGSGSALKGEGVPIRFDGRFLVRNSLVFG